jgi:hypothetical protein
MSILVYNNYWLAEDGRVYSSARQVIVTDADAEYATWIGNGNIPMGWPRDAAGNQTDDSLQDAIAPYGLFASLIYYSANARFVKTNAGVVVNGVAFNTDIATRSLLDTSVIFTQNNPGSTFDWKLPDGSYMTLDQPDAPALQTCIAQFAQACLACEEATAGAIDAGTIIDRAGVDAAYAAVTNVFTSATTNAFENRRRKPA